MFEIWNMIDLQSTLILSMVSFFLFLFFFKKVLRVRKTTREHLPFTGLALFFFCIFLAYFVTLWRGYLNTEYGLDPLVYLILRRFDVVGLVGFGILVFIAEYLYKKTKYLLSVYSGIFIIVGIFIDASLFSDYLLFQIPFFLLAVILFYYTFIKPTSGFLRTRMTISLAGAFIFALGILFRSGYIGGALFGDFNALMPSLFSICGLILFGYGFAGLSVITDLHWKGKLRDLFVISDSGICMYAYSFEKNSPLMDSDLIAMGFTGIQQLLSEMVKTDESLQLIDYQNVKIMVEENNTILFVLIIKEESNFLQFKLKSFSDEFISFYKEILSRWKGEMEYFVPTRKLIKTVFELDSR